MFVAVVVGIAGGGIPICLSRRTTSYSAVDATDFVLLQLTRVKGASLVLER